MLPSAAAGGEGPFGVRLLAGHDDPERVKAGDAVGFEVPGLRVVDGEIAGVACVRADVEPLAGRHAEEDPGSLGPAAFFGVALVLPEEGADLLGLLAEGEAGEYRGGQARTAKARVAAVSWVPKISDVPRLVELGEVAVRTPVPSEARVAS